MELSKWLDEADVSQRELARRVGYSSNGPLSKIIKGDAYVPPDQIPAWADALNLEGDKRAKFIEECIAAAMPEWHLKDIREMRSNAARAEKELRALLAFIAPTAVDDKLRESLKDLERDDLVDMVLTLARVNRKLASVALAPAGSPGLKAHQAVLRAVAQAWNDDLTPSLAALERVLAQQPPQPPAPPSA